MLRQLSGARDLLISKLPWRAGNAIRRGLYASAHITRDSLCYTEQYVLHALLAQSPRHRTLLTSHWLSRRHERRMQDTCGPNTASDVRLYGGCYWFEVV